jgi:hypothetical protein
MHGDVEHRPLFDGQRLALLIGLSGSSDLVNHYFYSLILHRHLVLVAIFSYVTSGGDSSVQAVKIL